MKRNRGQIGQDVRASEQYQIVLKICKPIPLHSTIISARRTANGFAISRAFPHLRTSFSAR